METKINDKDSEVQFLKGYIKAAIDISTEKAKSLSAILEAKNIKKDMSHLVARNFMAQKNLEKLELKCTNVINEINVIINEIKKIGEMLETSSQLLPSSPSMESDNLSSHGGNTSSILDDDISGEDSEKEEEDISGEDSEKEEEDISGEEEMPHLEILDNSDSEDSLFKSGCEIKCRSFLKWWK